MNFDYSEEQQLLQDSVARFVREQYDFDARRRILREGAGYSAANWQLFAELGWLAVPLPEAHGGLGGDAVDLAVLFEQFGRGLVVEPYLATVVLGAGAVAALGSPAQQALLLPRVIAGDMQLALAYAEPQSRYSLEAVDCRVRAEGGGWRLDGTKCVVLNAPQADLLLVTARDDDGRLRLLQVDPQAPGVSLRDYPTIDGTHAAELGFDATPLPADAPLGADDDALQALEALLDRAALCTATEAIGAMGVLLERTVEYTRTRKQFGVPIGSFQALQHRMTEMFIELEQARSIVLMALLASRDGASAPRAVSAAKARVGRAARLIGQEAIQLHGGIGVTDELDVGHYVKRLLAIETLFGNSDWHLSRFGRLDD